jgi:hypothetical protein
VNNHVKYNQRSADNRTFLLYCVRNGAQYDNCRFSMRFARLEGGRFDVFQRGGHTHPLGPVAKTAGSRTAFFEGAVVPRPRGTGVNAQARKRKAAKELQQKEVFV